MPSSRFARSGNAHRRAATALAAACAAAVASGVIAPAHATAAAGSAATAGVVPSATTPYSTHHVPVLTGAAVTARLGTEAGARFKAAHMQMLGAHHAASGGAASGGAVHDDLAAPSASAALAPWSMSYHADWGIQSEIDGGYPTGGEALQTLNPETVLPANSPDTLYMPTFIPNINGCIEVSTIYTAGQDAVGAWNWCTSDPESFEALLPVSSLLGTYTSVSGGKTVYFLRVVETDAASNTWTAYLYNYVTDRFDVFYTSSGTSWLGQNGFTGNWDMAEDYTGYNSATGEGNFCTEAPGADWGSTDLQFQSSVNGAFTLAQKSNSATFGDRTDGTQLGCEPDAVTITPDPLGDGFTVLEPAQ